MTERQVALHGSIGLLCDKPFITPYNECSVHYRDIMSTSGFSIKIKGIYQLAPHMNHDIPVEIFSSAPPPAWGNAVSLILRRKLEGLLTMGGGGGRAALKRLMFANLSQETSGGF